MQAHAVAKFNDDKIGKQKPVIDLNSRNVEQIIIFYEKRKEVLNELGKVL